MRPDTSDGPRNSGVLGRKRSSPTEKIAVFVSLVGPLPLRNFLKRVRHRRAVDGGFTSQQSRFRQVVIVLHLTEEKCSAAQTDERISAVVGKRFARCYVIDWNLLRPPAIGCDESRRNRHTRQDPLEILGLEVRRACPKLLLISNKMLQKWREQSVFRISARLQTTPGLRLRGRTLI